MTDPTPELVHCIYTSAAVVEFRRSELDALLAGCRRNNAELGVTGILLFQSGSFFQVLEGSRPVVEALFTKIERDPRHSKATKLILEPIVERSFPEWTMGFPRITTQELATIPGLNDFFSAGSSFMTLGSGRAKVLLDGFRNGKWRASLA